MRVVKWNKIISLSSTLNCHIFADIIGGYQRSLEHILENCGIPVRVLKKIIRAEVNDVLRCMIKVNMGMPQDASNGEEQYDSIIRLQLLWRVVWRLVGGRNRVERGCLNQIERNYDTMKTKWLGVQFQLYF